MFRKFSLPASVEFIGLALLILTISLITATLALAEQNHRAFDNLESLGSELSNEPTAPMNLQLQCTPVSSSGQAAGEVSVPALVTLQVTPHGAPVRAFVLSKPTGVCESQTLPNPSTAGTYETHTFVVEGENCDSRQGPVILTVSENRRSIDSRGKIVSLTVGEKSFSCRRDH